MAVREAVRAVIVDLISRTIFPPTEEVDVIVDRFMTIQKTKHLRSEARRNLLYVCMYYRELGSLSLQEFYCHQYKLNPKLVWQYYHDLRWHLNSRQN